MGATMQNLYSIKCVKQLLGLSRTFETFHSFYRTKHAIYGSIILQCLFNTTVIRVEHATYHSKCDKFKPLNRINNKQNYRNDQIKTIFNSWECL